jgi:hypothetical protein
MRFARVVFLVAGVWGIAVLTPLYFLVDLTGRQYTAPADYPQFFYGFLSVAMAWQIAFLVIGSSPARYRPLMIPSILEKLGHVAGVAVLYSQRRLSVADATAAGPDMLLAVLFIVAFAVTPTQSGIFEYALRLSGLSKRLRFPQRTVTLQSER